MEIEINVNVVIEGINNNENGVGLMAQSPYDSSTKPQQRSLPPKRLPQ
jgi:hypothetical protein